MGSENANKIIEEHRLCNIYWVSAIGKLALIFDYFYLNGTEAKFVTKKEKNTWMRLTKLIDGVTCVTLAESNTIDR